LFRLKFYKIEKQVKVIKTEQYNIPPNPETVETLLKHDEFTNFY